MIRNTRLYPLSGRRNAVHYDAVSCCRFGVPAQLLLQFESCLSAHLCVKVGKGGVKLQVDNLIDYLHLTLKRTSENQTQNSIETFQLDYFVSYIPLFLNGWARCEITLVHICFKNVIAVYFTKSSSVEGYAVKIFGK